MVGSLLFMLLQPSMNLTTDLASVSSTELSNTDFVNPTDMDNSSVTDEDPYYYYYSEHQLYIHNVLRILTITCYAVTMGIGTIGNVIVVYTIWRCRHLHTVMYTLLASLSIADLMVLVFVLPWRLHVFLYAGSWIFGDFMCRFPVYLNLLSAVCSVCHLTAISAERCYAVMFPLKSRTVLTMGNAYKIVAIVWVGSIIASIPAIFSVALKEEYFEGFGDYTFCSLNWPNEASVRAYTLYQFFLVFGVPMVIITACYAFIMRKLCTRRVPSESGKMGAIAMSQSRKYQTGTVRNGTVKTGSVYVANGTQKLNRSATKNKEAEIRQMTVMLVVVIVMFTVCWGPILTFSVTKRFGVVDVRVYPWWMLDRVFYLLSFTNSAVNPIVYALVSASFRQSCLWALKVCCKSRKVRRRPSGVSRATTVSRAGMSTGGGSTVMDNVSVSSVCAGDKV